MRGVDELALVVQVACETGDRSPDEQRALLSVALKVDCERAKWLTGASTPTRPHLFDRVEETYDPDSGRRVRTPKSMRTKLDRQIGRYEEGIEARRLLGVEEVPGPDTLSVVTGDNREHVIEVPPTTSTDDEAVEG